MDKRAFNRFRIAVYLLLAACAVILFFVAKHYVVEETLKSTLLNLATELAGATILFLVIDRLFQLNAAIDHESDYYREELGISKIFRDRDDLPVLPDQIGSATNEIYFFGMGLKWLITQRLSLIEDKLREGVSVRFLLFHPTIYGISPEFKYAMERSLSVEFGERIEDSLEKLARWRASLPSPLREKVQVRASTSLPTHTGIQLDKGRRNGRIILEMLPYKEPLGKHWSVQLESGKGRVLYELYDRSIANLWEDAHEVEVTEQ